MKSMIGSMRRRTGLIPSILDEPMDPGIRMTLLNAVYFKAAWVNAFEKELTDKQIFHGKRVIHLWI